MYNRTCITIHVKVRGPLIHFYCHLYFFLVTSIGKMLLNYILAASQSNGHWGKMCFAAMLEVMPPALVTHPWVNH